MVKNLPVSGFKSSVGNIPWSRKWQPTPVVLPGKFHGQRGLVGYRPWGHKESDMTEPLSTHKMMGLLNCRARIIVQANLTLLAKTPHYLVFVYGA